MERGRLQHMEKPPKKTTRREIVEATVEGAAGVVPFAGGPLAVAFAVAMGWTYNKRMTQWLDDLAEAVSQLQEQRENGSSFDELADDPVFVDAVVHATRAAQATHQTEKLEALRNAVLNSTLTGAPDIDEQSRFFRLVEEFTPAHIIILRVFADPGRWFDDHGLTRGNYMMGSRTQVLEDGVPEFRGQADWYNLLVGDLNRANLMLASLSGVVTGGGMFQPLLSPLGQRFLRFISDPR